MLIKQADDQSGLLAELEGRIQGGGPAAKYAVQELRNRRAGIRGEQQAAYLIDFDYAGSPNWAVIHDLRLEHGSRTAQIDHVLINRWMDIYVLETKSFHSGLKITEEGEFLRSNKYTKSYEGMPSPLQQNERHIQVLKDVITQIDLPTRLGLRIAPSFQSFVLVDPSARVIRPKAFDTSRVIKADQLKKSIWRDIDNENPVLGLIKAAAKIVSGETVEYVARQLVALHRPLHAPGASDRQSAAGPSTHAHKANSKPTTGRVRIEPTLRAPAPSRAARSGNTYARESVVSTTDSVADQSPPTAPTCKQCTASSGNILYGKYGYYFKCDGCSANTAVRFTCLPGHNPKLRKDREAFYRDCPQCRTSILFYRNQGTSES